MEGLSKRLVFAFGIAAAIILGTNLTLFLILYSSVYKTSTPSSFTGFLGQELELERKAFANVENTQVKQESKTISVIGTGIAKAKPDRALISFSVVTQAASAEEAVSENADKMNRIVKAVRSMGILENQTETSAYSLTPIWEYPKDGSSPRIVGYTCSNTIRVTVKDLNKVGEVIDVAVKAGANQVSSLQFTISDEAMRQLGLNALSLAVRDAASKASTIATAAEVTLIGPVSISLSGYTPYVRSYAFESLVGSVTTPIIPPEDVSVTVSVSAIYEFK